MSFIGEKQFSLETALGNVPDYAREFKFGKSLDCDSGVPTDIWDGADGLTSTDIWVAPTTARVHNIVSTDAADAAAGTGLRTVRVSGLTSWTTKEVSEVVTLNGLTDVPTGNSYVIVHRLEAITFGSNFTNEGLITATAVTDATVTAAIQIGNAQSLMAIYGLPSSQKIAVTSLDISILGVGMGSNVDVSLLINDRSDPTNLGFLTKYIFNVAVLNLSVFDPPIPFSGPLIIKLQANSDTNNTIVSGAFNSYVVDI